MWPRDKRKLSQEELSAVKGGQRTEGSLVDIDLSGEKLNGVDLNWARLGGSHFIGTELEGARFKYADLHWTRFTDAKMQGCDLYRAGLKNAEFQGAHLQNATLCEANLTDTDLSRADLSGADLEGARLIRTNLTDAILDGCRVYGVSTWGILGVAKRQAQLVVTPKEEPVVTVDDIEVAQLVYLLLGNKKIRNVIDNITSRAVLILGRFTAKRKSTLEALRLALREDHGLVPIIFDFQPSEKRDLSETVRLLASMCRFVIADLTDAKSIPQELSSIVPSFPSVPVQPIILSSQEEYALFAHWKRFPNVLAVYRYQDPGHLLQTLDTGVLTPIHRWEQATDKSALTERLLRTRVAELEAKLQAQGAN
jgi:uncharacterized protein YjbI with pentapeptide repeats